MILDLSLSLSLSLSLTISLESSPFFDGTDVTAVNTGVLFAFPPRTTGGESETAAPSGRLPIDVFHGHTMNA